MRYSRKRVHRKKIVAGFQEVFKEVCVKKTSQRNFFLTVTAVSVSKTFRITEITSRLPIVVEKEKSKQICIKLPILMQKDTSTNPPPNTDSGETNRHTLPHWKKYTHTRIQLLVG